MITDESKKLAALAILLRVYGVLTLVIFGSLLVGFAIQTPLLAGEPKGALNWVIWNGIRCGSEPCYVPPMLVYIPIRTKQKIRTFDPRTCRIGAPNPSVDESLTSKCRICAFVCATLRNGLVAISDQFPIVKQDSRGGAGGGARTHTALRPLDFESSASANSTTPAQGNLKLRSSRRSSSVLNEIKRLQLLGSPNEKSP